MTGIIVTGHGHFPSGILSAVDLVAGKPENVVGVDFEGGQSTDDLKTAMRAAIESLEGEDILILADLVGGTPFNTAVLLHNEMTEKHIRVMAGVNMAALVEAIFSRGFAAFDELIPMVKKAGADGIVDIDSLSEGVEDKEFEDGL